MFDEETKARRLQRSFLQIVKRCYACNVGPKLFTSYCLTTLKQWTQLLLIGTANYSYLCMLKYYRKNDFGETVFPSWFCLFVFQCITFKLLTRLTSIDTLSCFGGVDVTHQTAVPEVPGSMDNSATFNHDQLEQSIVNLNPMDKGFIDRWQSDPVITKESVFPFCDKLYHTNNGILHQLEEIKKCETMHSQLW